MRGRTKWICRSAAAAYLAFLTYLLLTSEPFRLVSFGPDGRPPTWISGLNDKVVHGAAYAILGGFAVMALGGRPALCWLLSAMHGAATELLQNYVPGRTCDLYDWFADAAGAACGVALGALITKLSARRRWLNSPNSIW